MLYRRAFAAYSSLFFSLFACQPELSEQHQPIVGGAVALPHQFPAVGALAFSDSGLTVFGVFCSGTLIDPSFVLTAAHCATLVDENSAFVLGTRVGSTDALITEAVHVEAVFANELFNIDELRDGNDIALLQLERPITDVAPIPINRQPLEELLQKTITAVGFGFTDKNRGDIGTKRFVSMPIVSVDEQLLFYGTTTENICNGDSGGPDLMDFDGETRVVGVHSFGTGSATATNCHNLSASQRVDSQASRFIDPTMAQATSSPLPCSQEGSCEEVAEGCSASPASPSSGWALLFLLVGLAFSYRSGGAGAESPGF